MRNYFFLLILLLLISCTYNTNVNIHDNNSLSIYEDTYKTKKPPESIDSSGSKINFANNIEIRTASFSSSGNIFKYNVEYPYLDEYSNYLAIKINKAIFETVISNNFSTFKDYAEDIVISYEIMYIDEQIISILFSGYISTRGSFSDYLKTITIDLTTGNVLELGDLFSAEEMSLIINEFILSDKSIITDDLFNDQLSKSYLQTFFANSFMDTEAFLSDVNSFYIKSKKLCLVGDSLPSMRNILIVEIELDKTPSP